jgi:hypothetical protein
LAQARTEPKGTAPGRGGFAEGSFGMLAVLVTLLANWCMRESHDDEVREDATTTIKCWSIEEAELLEEHKSHTVNEWVTLLRARVLRIGASIFPAMYIHHSMFEYPTT